MWLLPAWALLALGLAAPLAGQESAEDADVQDTSFVEEPTDSLVGAAVSVGEEDAQLEVQLSDGRAIQLELRSGVVYADGETLGNYDEGGALDRSWRSLLEEAAMASTVALPALLRDWSPPASSGAIGRELDERLEQALVGVGGRRGAMSTATFDRSAEDSIEELLERIDDLEDDRREEHFESRDSRADEIMNDVVEGAAGFFATLIWIGVLFGIGSALLFFGNGRLERVSATVREEPLRSGLVGLAGAFLAIPFYILVTLALAISILGIPLILAWGPLFPLLFLLAGMAGWLAVAYGTGDALVRGRLQTRPMFTDAGMYKRIVLGIAVLLTPFLLASLFRMTSVLEWAAALLLAIGVIGNLLVAAVGFGAVLTRTRDALDVQRERRAARRRARLEQQSASSTAQENTNV